MWDVSIGSMIRRRQGAAMDLTFKTPYGRFNYRVGAIIIHDDKVLLMKNSEVPYLYTIGGRCIQIIAVTKMQPLRDFGGFLAYIETSFPHMRCTDNNVKAVDEQWAFPNLSKQVFVYSKI